MAHIPPGVDLHSTVTKLDDVCDGQGPEMFLSSEKLADELAEFDDVVQLAIFAHTHMDEVRLLKPDNSNASPASRKGVAVKMVSSISPIDGNNPSFTVVQIDSASAALADYRVYEASNRTGVDAAWTEEYDFARTYGKAAFTPTSVSELIAGFAADAAAKTEASRSYISDFSLGYLSPVLKAFWPQYVCSLSNRTPNAYRSCVCSTAGK
jgi:sphingomyelin phosphodiesterase acid-like 3